MSSQGINRPSGSQLVANSSQPRLPSSQWTMGSDQATPRSRRNLLLPVTRRTQVARQRRGHHSRRRVPNSKKVERTFALWQRYNFNLKQFVRGLVQSDANPSRTYAKRRMHLLSEVLEEPEVKAALERFQSVEHQTAEEAVMQRMENELGSLVGKPFFGRWSVDDDFTAVKFADAFPVIKAHAPSWIQFYERMTRNQHSRDTYAERIKTDMFQRQLFFVTAVILRSRSRRLANFLPRIIGMTMSGSGVLRAMVDVLGGAGVCDTYQPINDAWKSVEFKSKQIVRNMARDPHAVVAYDNLNFLDTVRDHALGSSRAKFVNVTTGIIVKCPSLPEGGLKMSMLDTKHQLKLDSILKAKGLLRDDVAKKTARYFITQSVATLFESSLKKIFENAQSSRPTFPYIRTIPSSKATTLHPLAGMFCDEGTIDGTYDVHRDIFIRQFGFSEDVESQDFAERLWLVFGDQKTAAFIRTVKYEQRLSVHPYHKKAWMVGPPALFHMCMALLYLLVRTHFENPPGAESRSTLLHDIRYWSRTRINRENAKYHDVAPVVRDGFNSCMLAVFYDKLVDRGLLDLDQEFAGRREEAVREAIEKLIPAQFLYIVDDIEEAIFSHEAWRSDGSGDPEFTTFARLCREVCVFMTLEHAITHGDVGMIERLIFALPVLYYGAGQDKYGLEMIHLCWLLEASSPELRESILCAGLVNQKGSTTKWKPIDLAVEHLNLELSLDMRNNKNSTHDIRAIFGRVVGGTVYNSQLRREFETFFGQHTNQRHSRKSVDQDLLSLSFYLQKSWPCWHNEAQHINRFEAPDVIKEGLHIVEQKVQHWNDTIRQGRVATEAGSADMFSDNPVEAATAISRLAEENGGLNETLGHVMDPMFDSQYV